MGNREHVWPQWLLDLHNPTAAPMLVQRDMDSSFVTRKDGVVTRLVCEPCNRWMGRKFEQPVAPIVRSMLGDIELGSVLLYRKSQARLAAWAYKTTLMIETAREGGPQISDSAYRRFRSSGQPPGHCSIVLSRAGHGGLTYHRHATRGQHLNLEGIEQFYSAILVVKELFFHVLGDLPPGIAAKAHGSLFDSIPAWGKNTLWLWPSDGSRLSWPPHGYMSKDAIEHIANAFGGTFEFMEETAADHDSPAGG